MSYIILRNLNDINVQSRKGELNDAIERANELISSGIEKSLIVCEEIDNSAAKKADWTQPAWKREFICSIS